MKLVKTMLVLVLSVVSVSLSGQSRKEEKLMKDIQRAKQELLNVDPGLQQFFDEAAGYVILPNVGKGGFIIGGASGRGIVYNADGKAIGSANLKKLNIGLQAGGQAIIEAIFFKTEKAFDSFKYNNFSFSAGVSAVALRSGIAANAKYREDVAVFALPKAGLMADASVGGQRLVFKPFYNTDM